MKFTMPVNLAPSAATADGQCTVSTIIPTMATKERATQLKRAIFSIRASSVNRIEIIVVANGNRWDKDLCAWLGDQSDVHLEYLEEPSLPKAILRGRDLVQTPFFSTLDDDDEYLTGSTDLKLSALLSSPEAALVVTNGYVIVENQDVALFHHFDDIAADPLAQLFSGSWLNSANALYRTDFVKRHYFEDYHKYAEWTWLAFRISLEKKLIIALNQCTFRCHDTPNSLSKSNHYFYAYFSLYDRMLLLSPPPHIKKLVHSRISSAWHDKSVRALEAGEHWDAWKFHLRSLITPSGLRYMGYSRHLKLFF